MQLNKVWNGKCWAFALKSKKLEIMSDFKLEIDDRFNLFLWTNNKNKLVWFLVNFSINKPKMARFLKFKFLIILKLNFNGGQFYKNILNFGYFKKL